MDIKVGDRVSFSQDCMTIDFMHIVPPSFNCFEGDTGTVYLTSNVAPEIVGIKLDKDGSKVHAEAKYLIKILPEITWH